MSQSLYLKVAVLLIRADLRLEERRWQSQIRKQAYHLPLMSVYMLRDIGFTPSSHIATMNTLADTVKVQRRLYHIRRMLSSRITT
ncbi:DUF1127 domain-containing protein [Vibrio zhugei]|uniref:DUF1127 domain-containing protein n=1 Tax=Vibrio zhugei TaxID=2479546 RepID=A0ABV7C433_9VIBR|nr:DUF1127 domain-containing protein [Vibrio zhugei]